MLYQWSWIACLTSLCRASEEKIEDLFLRPHLLKFSDAISLQVYVHIGSSILCWQILSEQEIACKFLNVWCMFVMFADVMFLCCMIDYCSLVFCASIIFLLLPSATFPVPRAFLHLHADLRRGFTQCWQEELIESFKIVRHYGLES